MRVKEMMIRLHDDDSTRLSRRNRTKSRVSVLLRWNDKPEKATIKNIAFQAHNEVNDYPQQHEPQPQKWSLQLLLLSRRHRSCSCCKDNNNNNKPTTATTSTNALLLKPQQTRQHRGSSLLLVLQIRRLMQLLLLRRQQQQQQQVHWWFFLVLVLLSLDVRQGQQHSQHLHHPNDDRNLVRTGVVVNAAWVMPPPPCTITTKSMRGFGGRQRHEQLVLPVVRTTTTLPAFLHRNPQLYRRRTNHHASNVAGLHLISMSTLLEDYADIIFSSSTTSSPTPVDSESQPPPRTTPSSTSRSLPHHHSTVTTNPPPSTKQINTHPSSYSSHHPLRAYYDYSSSSSSSSDEHDATAGETTATTNTPSSSATTATSDKSTSSSAHHTTNANDEASSTNSWLPPPHENNTLFFASWWPPANNNDNINIYHHNTADGIDAPFDKNIHPESSSVHHDPTTTTTETTAAPFITNRNHLNPFLSSSSLPTIDNAYSVISASKNTGPRLDHLLPTRRISETTTSQGVSSVTHQLHDHEALPLQQQPNHQPDKRRGLVNLLVALWNRLRRPSNNNSNNNVSSSTDIVVSSGNRTEPSQPVTIRSLWRHRHARSAEEGIRRESTGGTTSTGNSARRLSSVLAQASVSMERTSRRMAARTITGLITALAEEVVDLDVEVDAKDETPYSEKHITAVRIKFARLGFKPLRMGGHDYARRKSSTLPVQNPFHISAASAQPSLPYSDRKLIGFSSWNDDDYRNDDLDDLVNYRRDDEAAKRLSADEAFDRIDVDQSGYLDREELVQALSLAAFTTTDNTLDIDGMDRESNIPILEKLASDLFELYDMNGDGVVDRREYKIMVEDMAALRNAQMTREEKQRAQNGGDDSSKDSWIDTSIGFIQNHTGFLATGVEYVQNKTSFLGAGVEYVQNKTSFLGSGVEFVQNKTSFLGAGVEFVQNNSGFLATGAELVQNKTGFLASGVEYVYNHSGWLPWRSEESDGALNATTAPATNGTAVPAEIVESVSKSLGSITFSDIKMDLRRLFFGAIPILKRIVPGGPLILEPFTTTITGSFDRQDIMNSALLDAGLRRLVIRALRRRVGYVRDLLEGAMFKGRSWKTFGGEGPRVDIPELTNVEFDANDKLIITGRARVKSSPDAPVIEQSFKVRTSIGTRKNGRFIRLEEPELALVLECPKSWERNLESLCSSLGLEKPIRPRPIYTFFPIYSPFKLQEDDGFDLGEDNSITSLYIKDGALRFEMSAILRPGRFLGSHYIAFTTPIRTFIVTLDRVTEGIRSARKGKKAARKEQQQQQKSRRRWTNRAEDALLARHEGRMRNAAPSSRQKKSKVKSFFSRFVDGYLQAERDEAKKERLTTAIRDFFGRQL